MRILDAGLYNVILGCSFMSTSAANNVRTFTLTVWRAGTPIYMCGQSTFTTNNNWTCSVNVTDMIQVLVDDEIGFSMKNSDDDTTEILGWCMSLNKLTVNV